MELKQSNYGRIMELDGLRGIAILLVISFHYINNQLVNSLSPIGKLLAKATSFGWVGVDLFFVLSGFLIGSVLMRTKESNNFFSTFYLRRFLRIIPNYYLLLVLFIIVQLLPYFSSNYMITGNQAIPLSSYFIMIHNFYIAYENNMGVGALSILWSIGIEEQFYLIFPFIVQYLKEKPLLFALVVFIIGASFVRLYYNNWIPRYVLLPARMDSISLGVLVAYFHRYLDFESFIKKNISYLILFLIFDVVICAGGYALYGDLGVIKHTLFAIAFTIALILALVKVPFYAAMLRNKLLCWIGTISYSLYLFHYFILILFQDFNGHENGVVINNQQDVMVTLLALACSFFIGWAIFKLLETPFVKWGKRFNY